MIARLALLVVLATSVPAHCAPDLLKSKSFSPVTLAEAVNYYVGLGEEATFRELASYPTHPMTEVQSRARNRIVWLLKILYPPRNGVAFRRPAYGAMGFEHLPLAEWPLLPVVQSGTTYFALGEGYNIRGLPESALDYLNYCRVNGRFRTTPVPIPTRANVERDGKALLERLKANDLLGENLEEYVKGQIQGVPEKDQ